MSAVLHLTEKELATVGLHIAGETMNKTEPNTTAPDVSWTLDQLADYIRCHLAADKDHNQQISILQKKSIRERFRIGQALLVVRDKLAKQMQFHRWCRKQQITRRTAYKYLTLAERAGTEDNIGRFKTWSKALEHYGVNKPKAKREARPDSPEKQWKNKERVYYEQRQSPKKKFEQYAPPTDTALDRLATIAEDLEHLLDEIKQPSAEIRKNLERIIALARKVVKQ